MWRLRRKHHKAEPGGLLSLSALAEQPGAGGRQQHAPPAGGPPGGLESTSPVWSPRSPGGKQCWARSPLRPGGPDGVNEAVASHEQLIGALQERVAALEDGYERLSADVLPALKLIGAVGQAQSALAGDAAAEPKDQEGAAAATGANAAGGGAKALGADAASWPALSQSLGEMDQAVSKALADLASWGAARCRDQAADREDCGSVRSFATSLSFASTQISGPAAMNDLRPAAKGPSRVPAQGFDTAAARVPLGGWRALGAPAGAAAPGARGSAKACNSHPLQLLALDEECTATEIQQLVKVVTGCCGEQQQQQEDEDGTQDDGGEEAAGAGAAGAGAEQQHRALATLALHAEHDEDVRHALAAEPALLGALAGCLAAPADDGRYGAAAHLVWFLSRSAELRPALQEQAGLLQALLALLSSQDAAAARAAAFALNNLAHSAECRAAMVDGGAVQGLLDMLRGCDALGQEAAAAALMMLASEEANTRAVIVKSNGVSALVAVLRYGGPAAQEAAAAALENLSLDGECEAALADDGAVPALLSLLKDGMAAAQAAAAGALRNLAVNEGLEGHLLACGTVPSLLALVVAAARHEDAAAATAALEALRNLTAGSTRAGDALVEAGGAAVLVDAARSLPAAPARSAALGALLVLSTHDAHRQAITAAGAAAVLVHAALAGSLLSKEYAARALANLSCQDAARQDLLREGAATVLAALLKAQLAVLRGSGGEGAGSAGCCLAAARALQNLSKFRPGCKQLLDAGCVAPLASALAVPGPLAGAAASALCSLCSSGRSLRELAEAGGCAGLVAAVAQPKHLTPRGQRQALRLLRRLVQGPARAAVQEQVEALGLQLAL